MKNRICKRVINALTVVALLLAIPVVDGSNIITYIFQNETVLAKTAKQKKKEAERALENVQNQIDNLQDGQAEVSQSISAKQSELNTILANQQQLQTDITNKQAEIEQCQVDLANAQAEAEAQYESMKLRIQFMYENSSSDSVWTAILEADGITDMLNRIEYVSDLYQSDRDLMTAYQDAVTAVETLAAQLDEDMNNLLALQDQYETQQASLESKLASLQSEAASYSSQIATAEAQAENYQNIIDTQAAIILAQEAAAAGANSQTYEGGGTGSSGLSSNVDYLKDDSYNPAPATSVSGSDIVAYALQFQGNPYVWGGNSLTEGCDCSGFVHLILAHFGISSPRYSQAFKNGGQAVSYNNMQAGDVVIYPGHVAIYIGNGCIVEAQSTRAGITANRSVNCHTITGIRRYY